MKMLTKIWNWLNGMSKSNSKISNWEKYTVGQSKTSGNKVNKTKAKR